ncbi:hypothetical protein niasHT_011260 [Heterodera trifolii]|uniref:Uncharacterized protein n=1 Tax=Heterodera trifolii TaxID=157864 RepID=A0ABD2L7R5_9BILA
MVIVYRPYVSRWRRAWTVIKAKPRFWLKYYPEFSTGWYMLVPSVIICLGTRFYIGGYPNNYGMGWIEKPFYRQHFEVRRPDDQMVLKWRLPEEYPARFQTNRQSDCYPTTAHNKHYAWDVK